MTANAECLLINKTTCNQGVFIDDNAEMTVEKLEKRAGSFKPFSRLALKGSIIDCFRKQVSEQAKRTAVKTTSVKWSYAELDRRSNCIANMLLNTLGGQPTPVAIMIGQSALAVAAILGAIKAGKIYVPLDLTEAANQISAKLHDAGASIILTDSANRDAAQTLASPQRTVIEVERVVATSETTDPSLSLEANRPVYIYYTSGSTGAPKGVFDDHRNVLHNVLRYTNTLNIGSDDRISLIQSPSFSGTVSSLFSALLNGAALHPFDLRIEGVSALSHCIRNEKLTMFHSVPSIFELLVATGDHFPSLRVIRLEGDQAFKRHVALFQANFSPPCVLVNGLGATETGLTRQFFIGTGSSIPGNAVPIGFATPDMEALVLSPEGGAVPSGEVGEIAIRSRYLARGYWGRPDLTSLAFLPCPNDPEARIYRSGDLGRLDEEGCLTYLGRRDFRVKVRGQWVDLEAIQEVITSRADVSAAIVLSLGGGDQVSKIVAYVVVEHSMTLNARTLRQALSVEFSTHMVPASFVFLDSMPLDANGKIARKELPPPDAACGHVEGSVEPALGELEKTLAQCWCKALRRDQIGRHDKFFDLGGDSLQAAELFLRIEKAIGRHLPHSMLLEADTVAEMATCIESLSPMRCLVPFQPTGSRPAFFCIHDVDGQVLNFRGLARHLGEDQPFYGIQSIGLDGVGTPLARIEDVAARYIAEVRRLQPMGPYYLGGYSMGGWIAFEMARQLRAAGQAVGMLALLDTHSRQGRQRATLLNWLQHHRHRLSQLRASALAPYLALRFRNMAELFSTAVRTRVFGAVWRLGNKNWAKMPKFLRRPIDANMLAIRSYHAHPYDGDAILFRALPNAWTHADAHDGWRDLIVGDLEVRSISGQHSEILEEPHVRDLAQALADCLNERRRRRTRENLAG